MISTIAYTDGSCLNTRNGGWAWVTLDSDNRVDLSGSGGVQQTTNQRMEIHAALEAVRSLPGQLSIISDSQYVVQCFEKQWYVKWMANGWRLGSSYSPRELKNVDLWKPLITLVLERGDVSFHWVKGHSGNPGNEAADQLCGAASLALDVAEFVEDNPEPWQAVLF